MYKNRRYAAAFYSSCSFKDEGGCLLADDGTVVKYLNSSDWTSEVRDGSQGQVMVEVPEHWIRFEN